MVKHQNVSRKCVVYGLVEYHNFISLKLIIYSSRPIDVYRRQFCVSIDEIKTILSLEFRRKLVDLSEKICLIKNLKMSLGNHRQIRLDK